MKSTEQQDVYRKYKMSEHCVQSLMQQKNIKILQLNSEQLLADQTIVNNKQNLSAECKKWILTAYKDSYKVQYNTIILDQTNHANAYSQYFPISTIFSQNHSPSDYFERTFQLKKIIDLKYNSSKDDEDLNRTFVNFFKMQPWDDLKSIQSFLNLKNKFFVPQDVAKQYIMLLFFNYAGWNQSTIKFYKELNGLNNVPDQVLYYKYQCIKQICLKQKDNIFYNDKPAYSSEVEKLKRLYGVKQITSLHLKVRTKQYFCIYCKVYNCWFHEHLEQITPQTDFVDAQQHRKKQQLLNVSSYEVYTFYKQRILKQAQNNTLQTQDNKSNSEIIFCGKNCYQTLDSAQFKEMEVKLNERDKYDDIFFAKIHQGIEIFGYQPCRIAILYPNLFNCKLIFTFLFTLHQLQYMVKYMSFLDLQRMLPNNKDDYKSSQIRQQTQKNKKLSTINRTKIKSHEKHNIVHACHHTYAHQQVLNYKQLQCSESDACDCMKRGFCDKKFCLCDASTCTLQRVSCSCDASQCNTKACPCFAENFECDPMYCNKCFDMNHLHHSQNKKHSKSQNYRLINKKSQKKCINNQILFRKQKRCVVAKCSVVSKDGEETDAGLGLLAVNHIEKDSFIMNYIGEKVEVSTTEMRHKWKTELKNVKTEFSFYTFQYSPDHDVDSQYFGNKSRFINHSNDRTQINCKICYIYSYDRFHISIFASRDIFPGEQLLFDYRVDMKTVQHQSKAQMQFWDKYQQNQKEVYYQFSEKCGDDRCLIWVSDSASEGGCQQQSSSSLQIAEDEDEEFTMKDNFKAFKKMIKVTVKLDDNFDDLNNLEKQSEIDQRNSSDELNSSEQQEVLRLTKNQQQQQQLQQDYVINETSSSSSSLTSSWNSLTLLNEETSRDEIEKKQIKQK